ncbi:all trans-polyprenyl-diphosphate synthase PDSS1-like [Clavelina lepadiformis]
MILPRSVFGRIRQGILHGGLPAESVVSSRRFSSISELHNWCNKPPVILPNICRVGNSTQKGLLSKWLNRQICFSMSQVHPVSFAHSKQGLHEDLTGIYEEIRSLLRTDIYKLDQMCHYYFDGKGKAIRPLIVFWTSRACNYHNVGRSFVSNEQKKVALISEMIHIGSLIHDDVVDTSDIRRGKSSVNSMCGDRNAVMAGNFVVSNASCLLSTIDDTEVTSIISHIIGDLVRGELMQQDNQGHFEHYLKKTYKKTASLIANCCKAAAHLSNSDAPVIEAMYQFGKNIGIAFQLVDDMLDFVSTAENLGKPSAADLKLGLATAPVLFACEKFPELHSMILRRFQKPGDVEFALNAVHNSDCLNETRILAKQYCDYAVNHLNKIMPSVERESLADLTQHILHRTR